MIVIAVGCYGAGAKSLGARNAIKAGMLQAMPHKIEPKTNRPMPTSMIGLRPMRSVNSEDRYRYRLREQVDREQPGKMGETTEIIHDRRHHRGQDGRIDRDQAHAEHDRVQDGDRALIGGRQPLRGIDCCSVDRDMFEQPPVRSIKFWLCMWPLTTH